MDTSTILTGQMQKYHSKIYDQTTTDPRTSYHHIYRQATSGYLYYPESRNGILPLQDKRKNQYSSSSKARTELLTSITDIRAIPNISAARILHCQGTWTSYIAIYGPKIPHTSMAKLRTNYMHNSAISSIVFRFQELKKPQYITKTFPPEIPPTQRYRKDLDK